MNLSERKANIALSVANANVNQLIAELAAAIAEMEAMKAKIDELSKLAPKSAESPQSPIPSP